MEFYSTIESFSLSTFIEYMYHFNSFLLSSSLDFSNLTKSQFSFLLSFYKTYFWPVLKAHLSSLNLSYKWLHTCYQIVFIFSKMNENKNELMTTLLKEWFILSLQLYSKDSKLLYLHFMMEKMIFSTFIQPETFLNSSLFISISSSIGFLREEYLFERKNIHLSDQISLNNHLVCVKEDLNIYSEICKFYFSKISYLLHLIVKENFSEKTLNIHFINNTVYILNYILNLDHVEVNLYYLI